MATFDLNGKTVAVYCASSNGVAAIYFEAARLLGTLLGQSQARLVYGGTQVGLMGAVAEAALSAGGEVIGVVPARINEMGIAHPGLTELILTDGMRERKAIMEEKADAFVVLPGGYGTWEELFEVLTLKQLGYHNKPIVLLNTNDYYTSLLTMFQLATDQHFMKPGNMTLFQAVGTPPEALEYIANYRPVEVETKWVPVVNTNGEIPGTE